MNALRPILLIFFSYIFTNFAANAQSNLTVYVLKPPWIYSAWGSTLSPGSTKVVFSGTTSIKIGTSPWGALSVHHGNWWSQDVDAGKYQSLNLAIFATTPGTVFNVFFENDRGQSFPHLDAGVIAANSWTVVSIPMGRLNPSNNPIDRISIQEVSGSAKTFYIDDLHLVGRVSGSLPGAPALISPANGSTKVPVAPLFVWHSSSYATSYALQYSTQSDFSSDVNVRSVGSDTSYRPGGDPFSRLKAGATYYWRVQASDSAGTSDWSSVGNFATGTPPLPPTLVSPPDDAADISNPVTFVWNRSSDAVVYEVQYSTIGSFQFRKNANTPDTSYTLREMLSDNTIYYWRVRSENIFGESDWSNTRHFTTH